MTGKEVRKVSVPYQGPDGKLAPVSVNLVIDWDARNFSVESSCHDGAFRFQIKSEKHRLWTALAHCIVEAIEVGNEELNKKL